MKYLSKEAEAIFHKVIAHLKDQDHVKIDNAPGAFMALSVEFIYETKVGKIYALTHWAGPVNGDLCRDPDLTFLDGENGVSPLEFQQDLAGAYTEAAVVEEGKLVIRDMRQYNSLVAFCNTWLSNIKEQQRIEL
jgi:hypothetical protein